MELQFLGTSAGTPTKRRNVSGLAVKKVNQKSWILVDCGEGTQQQILHTPLSLVRLQAICITHLHGDHCYGLPGLLASASLMGRTEPLTLIGPAPLRAWLTLTQQVSQLVLNYELHCVDVVCLTHAIEVAGFMISAHPLSHRVPCFAYQLVETGLPRHLDKEKLLAEGIASGPIWGQLHRGETVTLADGRSLAGSDYWLPTRVARRIIIAGDNDRPDLLAKASVACHLLVHEATYTQAIADKVGSKPQHSSAKMIATFAQEVGLSNLLLTHFSPRYQAQSSGLTIDDIEQEARAYYSGNLHLAEDLAIYHLDSNGHLSQRHFQ